MKKAIMAIMFAALAAMGQLSAQTYADLVPKPQSLECTGGSFEISGSLTVYADKCLEFEASFLKERLSKVFAFRIGTASAPSGAGVSLRLVKGLGKEAYELRITEAGVEINASARAGVFYGVQTLLQMFPAEVYGQRCMELKDYTLDGVTVLDEPRYGYRGAMLDVSRTFYDVDHVLRLLDWMAAHKLNRFHWHLADDNGWRVEIKKYPELTSKGAWRGDNEVSPAAYGQGHGRYGGYYTQKEIRKVVQYAADRNIEIIPEIDLPGHSRSLVGVFPDMTCKVDVPYISANGETHNVLCVAREENYRILRNIFKEIAALFPSEYIHVGGDEVDLTPWTNCPECQKLVKERGYKTPAALLGCFTHRVEGILSSMGKKMAGWDEIVEGDSYGVDAMVYAWRNVATGKKSIEKGYRTVVQIGEYCYLDMKQSPAERGHSWAGIVPLSKTYSLEPDEILVGAQGDSALIVGVQAGLWTELMANPPRWMEHQYFPRLCALAEVGWNRKDARNFEDFENRLYNRHFARMYNMGIAFRVAPPEVTFDGQQLQVAAPHPSAVVRYTMDGSAPKAASPVCRGNIVTDRPENFRFATFFADELSSVAVGASNIELYKWLDPEMTIVTNIPLLEGNYKGLTKRGKPGYSKRVLQAGDTLAYRMAEPVECGRITVKTGAPSSDMFYVTDAYIEYVTASGDVVNAGSLKHGCLAFEPQQPVAEVRIVVTDSNDAYTAIFQGLYIEE